MILRTTRSKRKLLTRAVLQEVNKRRTAGVPLALIVRQLELNLTRRALASLLQWYQLMEYSAAGGSRNLFLTTNLATTHAQLAAASLFPEWLDQDYKNIQENPPGWVYEGRFPLGKWYYDSNN